MQKRKTKYLESKSTSPTGCFHLGLLFQDQIGIWKDGFFWKVDTDPRKSTSQISNWDLERRVFLEGRYGSSEIYFSDIFLKQP